MTAITSAGIAPSLRRAHRKSPRRQPRQHSRAPATEARTAHQFEVVQTERNHKLN